MKDESSPLLAGRTKERNQEDCNNGTTGRLVQHSSSLSLGTILCLNFMVGILGVIIGAYLVRMTDQALTGNPVRRTSMSLVPLLGSSHHDHRGHHNEYNKRSAALSPFSMRKRVVDKGNWIESFSLTRGVLVTSTNGEQSLYASGQTSYNGTDMVGGGEIGAQFEACLLFISKTLLDAGMTPCNVVHVTFYVTDMDGILASWAVWDDWMKNCPDKPGASLIGVATLFSPEAHVEVEVRAVL